MTGRSVAIVLSLALVGPATARAGTFSGETTSNAGNIATCPANWTVVPNVGGSYQTAAGVVTKWFTYAAASTGTMRLVMVRGSYPSYTVVGESADQNVAAGSNVFATRIPVQAGDIVAATASGGPCLFSSSGSSVNYCVACDGGPGSVIVADQLQTDDRLNAQVFVEADSDADGWGDESQDNCQRLANPDQANADGDGSGDACDVDDDNDSVLDGDDAFPLDASEWHDADGDGVGDNSDADDDNDGVSDIDEARAGSDPLNAASRPSTPASQLRPDLSFPPAEGSIAAPVLRAPATIRLAKLRKGIRVSAATRTRARLDLELRVTPKGVHLARFDLLLAARSLGVGSGTRSATLKPDKRFLRAARRFTLQLRVVATDLGGNRAVAQRTIKVRG